MEAFDRVLAKKRVFEKIRSKPMRRRSNEDAVGFCQRLKSRSQVGRVANNGLFSSCPNTGRLADHDQTGRNTDPRLQRRSVWLFQMSEFLNYFEARSDCAFGSVLLCLRKPEVNEDAIAEVLRNKPIVFCDHRYTCFAVLTQKTDDIFGV